MIKYFFPDSQDFVDPSFNFNTEERNEHRVRQRDDRYAHELFEKKPYDGLLVSKAIVDGIPGHVGKTTYSAAQRHRFYREKSHRFFRLPSDIKVFGDCGAFSYAFEDKPPFTVEDTIDFYTKSGVDYGISLDHIVFMYTNNDDINKKRKYLERISHSTPHDINKIKHIETFFSQLEDSRYRQSLTLDNAEQFLIQSKSTNFIPYGVAHGWDLQSYGDSVKQLMKMGYDKITLGGLVPLQSHQLLELLSYLKDIKKSKTQFHLLGISRVEHAEKFSNLGVSSFDSTTPLLQAFKDSKKNYHTISGDYYTALKVPQIDANLKLKNLIQSGSISHDVARIMEKRVLNTLQAYESYKATLDDTLHILMEYEMLHTEGRGHMYDAYHKTLSDRPWESCGCEICDDIGINVVIYRGAERNKRRGFHNIQVKYTRLQQSR
ncbi:tRNA-guanine transglycosylase DpdA [Moritella dasanensis]|uniref:tRNA-guanine transglycosylase DpdA n=1 Tax=Moritella dasanensis TaxID=428031 RepID=UPI0002EB310B|nr:tRNA-guanine transglycosylase DpdA [Moritella dasanensis]